jgi:acid stress-induced BolA-like protein IbaG/YrbA
MQASELQALIKRGIPGAEVTIRGDGDHFEAVIVSEEFSDRTLVQQHQLFYATLGDCMGSQIHALALKTYTPEEWAKQ